MIRKYYHTLIAILLSTLAISLGLSANEDPKLNPNSYFERDGWPEEGIPILSFKSGTQSFCEAPHHGSKCSAHKVPTHEPFSLIDKELEISSRYITISPVTLIAKEKLAIEPDIRISKGQKVLYLQYWSEGIHLFEIGGEIQSFFYDFPDSFENSQEYPVVEWWVHIKDYGWFEVTNKSVNLVNIEY